MLGFVLFVVVIVVYSFVLIFIKRMRVFRIQSKTVFTKKKYAWEILNGHRSQFIKVLSSPEELYLPAEQNLIINFTLQILLFTM